MMVNRLSVEIVQAWPDRVWRRRLHLAEGSTVADALAMVDLSESPEAGCGIFGQPAAPTQVLREGDRIELYRNLLLDPKEIRRQRAMAQAADRLRMK